MEKAAFIDVDGTLTSDISSWASIHNYFDLEEEMEENSKLFFSGQIDYIEWALRDVALWKGRSVEDLKKALLPPKLLNGAKKGVNTLKKEGYKVYLVSGGVNILVDEVAILVEADEAYSNVIGHKNGVVDGTVSVLVADKASIINDIAKKYNYKLDQCIAIGDNVNDIEMFEIVGRSFAINPKNRVVEQSASKVFNTDDFYSVIKSILKQY